MKMRFSLGVIVPAFFMIASAPAAVAGDVLCPPNIIAPTVVSDNVETDGNCSITGTVEGNVTVFPGDALFMFNAEINGNIEAEGAVIFFGGEKIDGNVIIFDGPGVNFLADGQCTLVKRFSFRILPLPVKLLCSSGQVLLRFPLPAAHTQEKNHGG